MPEGLLVTVPVPLAPTVSCSMSSENVAVTAFAESMVTMQAPVPVQAPDQPAKVEPTGHYSVRLVFDDGHDSGLYTWAYLYELGRERMQKWQRSLDRLTELGLPYPTPMPAKQEK